MRITIDTELQATATSKSTALMTDPMVAFAMNMVAGQAVTVTVEERATDLWD